MRLARPAAVVFDMDGLLFDTEKLYFEALRTLVSDHGLHPIGGEIQRSSIGLCWQETRRLLDELLPPEFDPDQFVADWKAGYDRLADSKVDLKPGAIELLDHLEVLEIPCAVASNSHGDVTTHHLAKHGLSPRFRAVVSGNDCVRGKPAPDPYLEAARLLGVPPADCLALEDSANGVLSASSAGMLTIMIPDMVQPDETTELLCVAVVGSLTEVREMLGT